MPLVLTPFKTTNVSYWPLSGGVPCLKLDVPANVWDDLMDYLVANVSGGGGLGDPGSNGIVKRTALNTTAAAVAGTDYVAPSATPTSWAAPSLLNGWSNVGGGYQVMQYRIDELGKVHLRGVITGGTTAGGTTLFVLPSGFRPPSIIGLSAVTGGNTAILLTVDASGNVQGYGLSTNVYITVSFPTL